MLLNRVPFSSNTSRNSINSPMWALIFLVLPLAFCIDVPKSVAQTSSTGALSGTISDKAGASIPDAQISGQASGSVAVIYYWKAKPGKSEEYNQYIRNVAELVDADARRQGAFISVTTFVSRKSDSPWTHMRIFLLKDHAQEANLAQALHEADVRMEPDEGKRKAKEDQAASLRDFVAREEVDILK